VLKSLTPSEEGSGAVVKSERPLFKTVSLPSLIPCDSVVKTEQKGDLTTVNLNPNPQPCPHRPHCTSCSSLRRAAATLAPIILVSSSDIAWLTLLLHALHVLHGHLPQSA